MAAIILKRSHYELMKEHVNHCLPEEGCGLLFGEGCDVKTVIPITNQLHSQTEFLLEPVEQVKAFLEMEAKGEELLAVFHSHPKGPSHPSAKDISNFTYPGTFYLIWYPFLDNWGCRVYAIEGVGYREIHLEMPDRPV